MIGKMARISLIPLVAGLLLACDPDPSQVEEQIGSALDTLQQRQTANPDASEKLTPVEGLPATTAADVVTNYHENQKTEAQERRQSRQRDSGLVDIDN